MRTARGFTLIEVVVAFALLAFALTLLLGAMTRATTQVRNAERAGRAALHAQSLLDEVGVGEPLVPGSREGDLEDGHYRWTLQVAEWQDPDPAAAAHAATLRDLRAPRLLELELVVAWGAGGERERLVVRSLRRVHGEGGS